MASHGWRMTITLTPMHVLVNKYWSYKASITVSIPIEVLCLMKKKKKKTKGWIVQPHHCSFFFWIIQPCHIQLYLILTQSLWQFFLRSYNHTTLSSTSPSLWQSCFGLYNPTTFSSTSSSLWFLLLDCTTTPHSALPHPHSLSFFLFFLIVQPLHIHLYLILTVSFFLLLGFLLLLAAVLSFSLPSPFLSWLLLRDFFLCQHSNTIALQCPKWSQFSDERKQQG